MKYYAAFENISGVLYSNGVNLVELARREGTPLLVTSEKRLIENYNSIYENFTKNYNKFKINYAVKGKLKPGHTFNI
jgi:Diaminopimelate decarboxylase